MFDKLIRIASLALESWVAGTFLLPVALLSLIVLGALPTLLVLLLASIHLGASLSFRYGTGESMPPVAHAVVIGASIGGAWLLLLQLGSWPPLVNAAVGSLLATITYILVVRIPPPEHTRLDGHVIIVTGSSAGIGREVATRLLGLGATVVFACRSQGRAQTAIEHALKVGLCIFHQPTRGLTSTAPPSRRSGVRRRLVARLLPVARSRRPHVDSGVCHCFR